MINNMNKYHDHDDDEIVISGPFLEDFLHLQGQGQG